MRSSHLAQDFPVPPTNVPRMKPGFFLLVALFLAAPILAQVPPTTPPPVPNREFRGVWVASVANIDWPSKPGLTSEQQQAELVVILDKCAALHLNAVVFQIRPACDALYPSPYEPWSEYLTGTQGKAPEPLYDPLAFAVAEAHKRGLALHAWFNPYRARHASAKSPPAAAHISQTHPEWVKTYGKSLWLDPGEPAVQKYSLAVISDVVRRYDIDGVHIDDYFYPYKERGPDGQILDFPDDVSWGKYRAAGGKKKRDDWRRDNVNRFVEKLYQTVKREKKWVQVGISPFGIYRPGFPEQIKGFDAYREIYCDSRLWLQKGWLDYLSPQLYWKIEQTPQSFPVLLNWWAANNPKGRHIWPGLFTSKYDADEIAFQTRITRGLAQSGGAIHFSMTPILSNKGGIADTLASVYSSPALVPVFSWLDDAKPAAPTVTLDNLTLFWTGNASQWLVQTRIGSAWTTQILPGLTTSVTLASPPDAVQISAISRTGIQGFPAVVSR